MVDWFWWERGRGKVNSKGGFDWGQTPFYLNCWVWAGFLCNGLYGFVLVFGFKGYKVSLVCSLVKAQGLNL